MSDEKMAFTVDDLAQEIRRVDGDHALGAGALAEALMPFIDAHLAKAAAIESVIACLGDDAATLRDRNPEDEMASNMDEAAQLLAALAHPRPTGDVAFDLPGWTEIRGMDKDQLEVVVWAWNLGQTLARHPENQATFDSFIDAAMDAWMGKAVAPTVEQTGEVVAWLYRSPAQIEFDRKPTLTDDAELVRLMREVGDHEIISLVPGAGAQPRPVGVPDGWHKIGFVELSALARLMEGSKQAETLFVIGGGCQPQDVYVKLSAAPSPAVHSRDVGGE